MRCMQHVADCLYLIQLDEREKFKTYAKMFKDDTFAIALFNRAPFAFKTEGQTDGAIAWQAPWQNRLVDVKAPKLRLHLHSE